MFRISACHRPSVGTFSAIAGAGGWGGRVGAALSIGDGLTCAGVLTTGFAVDDGAIEVGGGLEGSTDVGLGVGAAGVTEPAEDAAWFADPLPEEREEVTDVEFPGEEAAGEITRPVTTAAIDNATPAQAPAAATGRLRCEIAVNST